MAKTNLPARAGAQLPANWEAQLAADAAKAKDAESSTGGAQWLSIRGGALSFQGSPIPGSTIEAVVLDTRFENAYFVGGFDPEKFHPPVCFAIAETANALAPGDDSHDKQSDACDGCPQNAFGTSERGKGKACKNVRRLALLHVDYLKPNADMDRAPIVGLKVPPTSLTAWAEHVRKLANVFQKPPYCFVTRITVTPDPKVQVRVSFELIEEVKDRKLLGAIFAKRAEAGSLLDARYEWTDDEAQPQQRKRAEPRSAAKVAKQQPAKLARPAPATKSNGPAAKPGFRF